MNAFGFNVLRSLATCKTELWPASNFEVVATSSPSTAHPGCQDGAPGQVCNQYLQAIPDPWSMAIERRCQEIPQKWQRPGSTTEHENQQIPSPCPDRGCLPPYLTSASLYHICKTRQICIFNGLMGTVGDKWIVGRMFEGNSPGGRWSGV